MSTAISFTETYVSYQAKKTQVNLKIVVEREFSFIKVKKQSKPAQKFMKI